MPKFYIISFPKLYTLSPSVPCEARRAKHGSSRANPELVEGGVEGFCKFQKKFIIFITLIFTNLSALDRNLVRAIIKLDVKETERILKKIELTPQEREEAYKLVDRLYLNKISGATFTGLIAGCLIVFGIKNIYKDIDFQKSERLKKNKVSQKVANKLRREHYMDLIDSSYILPIGSILVGSGLSIICINFIRKIFAARAIYELIQDN